MYFNHQLHYSVSSTASSVRERLFFFLDLFYFQSIENSVDNFVGTERETERENTSKTKAVLRRFSDSLVNFLLEKWGQPHTFRFAHRFFLRQSFFLWIFRTSKGVIYWRAYNEYSNRHAPDYIFKNGIATRYGGNIKDLSWCPSRFHPESRDPCVEGRGGGGRAKESHIIESLHLLFDLIYFLSLAMYLNCFLMGLPSMSTKRKVLVAEVERPRHLVGFHRPGAFHTLFRLGALILSTDFLTASRRSKRAE